MPGFQKGIPWVRLAIYLGVSPWGILCRFRSGISAALSPAWPPRSYFSQQSGVGEGPQEVLVISLLEISMVVEKTYWLASKHLPEKTFQKETACTDAGAAPERAWGPPAHHHRPPPQSWAPRGPGIKENGDIFLSWTETMKCPPAPEAIHKLRVDFLCHLHDLEQLLDLSESVSSL